MNPCESRCEQGKVGGHFESCGGRVLTFAAWASLTVQQSEHIIKR